MHVISCEELGKSYRSKKVLQSIDVKIENEKIVGLIGRNGVGKSTLLSLLAGHLKPSKGEIRIFGNTPFNSLKVAADLILIDEKMTFPSNFTLGDIFKMAKDFYPKWQEELAQKLLAYSNISIKSLHQNLSKGQRSTFNLIYGLATRCSVTLLDEPMNGVDEMLRMDMYRVILKEYIAYPRIIVISSHHLQEIEHLLEEIILIHDGVVKLHAPLEDVKEMLVSLKGNEAEIKAAINNQEILIERQSAIGYEVIVEKSRIDMSKLQNSNVNVSTLTASEVCNCLITKGRGGIEDVFN